jgi:hypothetical protein
MEEKTFHYNTLRMFTWNANESELKNQIRYFDLIFSFKISINHVDFEICRTLEKDILEVKQKSIKMHRLRAHNVLVTKNIKKAEH